MSEHPIKTYLDGVRVERGYAGATFWVQTGPTPIAWSRSEAEAERFAEALRQFARDWQAGRGDSSS